MRIALALAIALVSSFAAASSANAAVELKAGDPAPGFTAKTQDGKDFSLASRRGKWTVLYFYPKANTPGCTKEACTFRDNIRKIRAEGADVFGVSADTVADQAAFHKEHHLNFTLLADPEDKAIDAYGTRMDGRTMSKRWTFIIDPEMKIRKVAKDVDPVVDSEKVAGEIAQMKK